MIGFLLNWRTWGSVALVLAVGGSAWTYRYAKKASIAADPELARQAGKEIPVRTVQVEQSEYDQVIGGTAITMPSKVAQVQLGPSAALKATDLVFKKVEKHEGDHVDEGGLLFTLEDKVFSAMLKQKEKAFAAAQAEYDRVKKSVSFKQKDRELGLASANANLKFRTDDLENRKKAFEIIQRLFKEQASTVIEYFNLRSLYAQAQYELTEADRILKRAKNAMEVGLLQDEADLRKAESDLEAAHADLVSMQHDLDRIQTIKSPLEGFVNYVSKEPVPGQVTDIIPNVMTEILKLDPLFVRMDFPQERIDDLSPGQDAEIVLDPWPKLTFNGKVIRISPQVNSHLRVLSVTIELSNPGNRIKTGISGFVRLKVPKKSMTVPAHAVQQRGSRAMVFVVEDGKAHIKPVTTGFSFLDDKGEGRVEVKDGVKPGDNVVIYDPTYLNEGMPVNADWRKWTRRD
jgi:RND family efflux transporter MFP subunit